MELTKEEKEFLKTTSEYIIDGIEKGELSKDKISLEHVRYALDKQAKISLEMIGKETDRSKDAIDRMGSRVYYKMALMRAHNKK